MKFVSYIFMPFMFFRLSERTYSLWGYINNNREEYLNPLYNQSYKDVLFPDLRPQFIRYVVFNEIFFFFSLFSCNLFFFLDFGGPCTIDSMRVFIREKI